MRGHILDFDFRTAEGLITGEDGARYRFAATDWKQETQPISGNAVDFEIDGDRALAIYPSARILQAQGGPRPERRANVSGEKSKVAAALLAFFLGGLGVHKFYLGKPGAGITMLLISVFGFVLLFLPTLIIGTIAFIEFIIYLTLSDEEFERRYVDGNQSWF